MLGGGLFGLTLVLDQGQSWGWTSFPSIICYALTIMCAIIFYFVELYQPEPIVNFEFFKKGIFVNTLLNNFIVFMALIGSIFLIPIFAETFLGYDATQTGYLFIPLAIALMAAAPIGGRLIGKVKPSIVIFASTIVAGIGMLMLTAIDPRSTALDLSIPMSIMAFGLGFGMAQRTNLVAVAVPKEDIGEASAILALVRNISGAFGVAIFSTILSNAVNGNVLSIARESVLRAAPSNAAALHQFIGLIELKAQIAGYATVFEIAAWIVILGAFTSFLIRIPKDHEGQHEHVMVLD